MTTKKNNKSEKHYHSPYLQFPLYLTKQNLTGLPPIRSESEPTDSDTSNFTDPRTSAKSRSADAAQMRGKDKTDYTPVSQAFKESVKAPRSIIATYYLPALTKRSNAYGAYLVRVGLDCVPELRSQHRSRVHVRYPYEEIL